MRNGGDCGDTTGLRSFEWGAPTHIVLRCRFRSGLSSGARGISTTTKVRVSSPAALSARKGSWIAEDRHSSAKKNGTTWPEQDEAKCIQQNSVVITCRGAMTDPRWMASIELPTRSSSQSPSRQMTDHERCAICPAGRRRSRRANLHIAAYSSTSSVFRNGLHPEVAKFDL